ncbi:Ca(2+)-dependent cysteine protease [Ceratobasidium sp. 392]|nr:Ca(2+)-dependent cysteine protease [Ceratobasidium sp. 392]
MSWNNQYQPPSGPPPGQFGFPDPSQYAPPPGLPPHAGYNPTYGPPSGPPPGQFGFPQPSGGAPGYSPSYVPPPGPPPIPGNRPGGGYAPPPGPPPLQHRASGNSGYPGQSYHQSQNNNGQGWQQNNPSYPGGAPVNWNNQGQGGALNSNAGSPPPASWYNGANSPPGGQTGYGTGGPGHPGGTPAMGNAHMPPSGQQTYGSSQGGGPQMSFQYSMCTGRKKALTIGINYFGQTGELRGCINDSNNVKSFLCRQFGYKNEDIVQLTDDTSNPRQKPTKANIIAAMQWLVKDAQPNDSLFFHYSGHGGQTKDLDGDEADGQDEDSQTSADTVEAGEATGAMSYAFIEVLGRQPQQSYQELLNNIRDILRSKYSQKPQLSSSHPMDTTVLFIA